MSHRNSALLTLLIAMCTVAFAKADPPQSPPGVMSDEQIENALKPAKTRGMSMRGLKRTQAAESAAAWTAARGSTHSRTRRRPPAQRSPRPAPGTGAARNERDSQPRPAGRDDRDLEGYVDQRATELGAPQTAAEREHRGMGYNVVSLPLQPPLGPGDFRQDGRRKKTPGPSRCSQ